MFATKVAPTNTCKSLCVLSASARKKDAQAPASTNLSASFVGWALPTVFPVFMRLSWWAEPTLLKSCWDDAYVGQQ